MEIPINNHEFKIILADCAISLVPNSWLKDRSINSYYKKYKRLPLIDGSIHQHLINTLSPEKIKDRPDILHFGLLSLLGYSHFFPNMNLEFYSDRSNWYSIRSDTRLPRSQLRFYGILEQILSNNYSGNQIKKISPTDFNSLNSIAFSSSGRDFLESDFSKNNFIFGGFAHGEYKSINSDTIEYVRLAPYSLDLWTSLTIFLNKFLNFHDYKL